MELWTQFLFLCKGGTTKEAVEGAFSFGAGITGVPTVYSNDFPGIPDSGTVIRVKVGESLESDVEMKVILKKSDGYNFTIIGKSTKHPDFFLYFYLMMFHFDRN